MNISSILNSEILKNNIQEKKIAESDGFKDFLLEAVNKLNTYESQANELGEKLASGEIDNIHEVMIASEKADIALQFAIEVKNKVMDAYKEIMRIQI